jgi:hypothetical protein
MQRPTVAPFSWSSVQSAIDRVVRAFNALLADHNLLGGRSTPGCHPPQAVATGMTTAQRLALTPPEGTIVYDTDLDQSYVWDGSAWQTLSGGVSAHNALPGRSDPDCPPSSAITYSVTTAERIALVPPIGTIVYDTDLVRPFAYNGAIWQEV